VEAGRETNGGNRAEKRWARSGAATRKGTTPWGHSTSDLRLSSTGQGGVTAARRRVGPGMAAAGRDAGSGWGA